MIEEKLNNLSRIISQLRKAYERFFELADKQRRDLVNNDILELNACNRAIDELVQETQELEQQRLLLMGHLEAFAGRTFESSQEILNAFNTEAARHYGEEVAALKKVLSEVAKNNQLNQRLIRSSREFVRSNIAIITGFAHKKNQAQKFQTYGGKGTFAKPAPIVTGMMNKEV